MDAFRRIFWKEASTQWHVWAALAVGILLLQLLVASIEPSQHPSMRGEMVPILFGIAIVLSVCYAAASASILIAGEQEDETAFLLRTFPLPAPSLIGGKLAYTIVSLLALLAVGSASAGLAGIALSPD